MSEMDKISRVNTVSRRKFLKYAAFTSGAFMMPLCFSGCAVNPVTGENQLMLVSRSQEIALDRQRSKFQFSSDYGITRDEKINKYIEEVGKKLLVYVQRSDMPYNFHCVNATYINAYAFPGGSIAVTRGILLKLDNEAQLASLLGHELGHVNARHTAQQISKGRIASIIVGGLIFAANSRSSDLGNVARRLGMLSQSLLLSKYSRDHERQADFLGNAYMVKAGYSSHGFVQLMQMLNSLHKKKPDAAQILFSSHPMSSERLAAALAREKGMYKGSINHMLGHERFMDRTASLRAKKKGIELLQQGESFLGQKKYAKAEKIFTAAVNEIKTDYTAHVLMAKCLILEKKVLKALRYADRAKQLYPDEAQGYFVSGLANLGLKHWTDAYQDFDSCDNVLPGNPQITFYKGYCLDQNGQSSSAAAAYMTYLEQVGYQPGKYSKYAHDRLKKWGYIN